MRTIEEALNSIVWYNGIYEVLIPLRKELEAFEGRSYSYPDFEKMYNLTQHECGQVQIFWMLLVLRFGNYGTSPRYGWLEMEHKEEIIKFLTDLTTIDGRNMDEDDNVEYEEE